MKIYTKVAGSACRKLENMKKQHSDQRKGKFNRHPIYKETVPIVGDIATFLRARLNNRRGGIGY